MKVKAKHWLKYDGVWHPGGEIFEIAATDEKMLNGMIELAEEPIWPEEKPAEEIEKPKRGRKKKTEE